jgi:L-asparaginase
MKDMKKKILVLFCGGTIVMVENHEGVLVPSDEETALRSLNGLEPRLEEWANIDLVFIANIDSANMTPTLWEEIATVIHQNYAQYDGFVVTHGTDTMAYTASALSFVLQDLGKPVVFTGAQIPGHHIESDAKRNLVNAVRLALMDVAGVLLVFDEQVILGARSSKVSHTKLAAFTSVNQPPLMEIGVFFQPPPSAPKRHAHEPRLEMGFDPQIAVISLIPGMPISLLDALLDSDPHGIVLIAYGSGNIPETYLPFLERAQKNQVPVVIRSQCLEGSTRMQVYTTGKQALDFDVIEAYDMSLETTIVKLMWALKRGVGYEGIKTIMHTNYVGELR